jgi:hypothetical protein
MVQHKSSRPSSKRRQRTKRERSRPWLPPDPELLFELATEHLCSKCAADLGRRLAEVGRRLAGTRPSNGGEK